jgi:hypothetical protein
LGLELQADHAAHEIGFHQCRLTGDEGARRTSALTPTRLRRYGLTILMFGVRRSDDGHVWHQWRSEVGYALCGGNAGVMERSRQFFDKTDRERNGATATPLEGAR